MANLTRTWRWHRWAPSLGGNLDLPEKEQFVLELGVGLTKSEMKALSDKVTSVPDRIKGDTEEERFASLSAEFAEALSSVVKMGSVPLTVNGTPIATLGAYVTLLLEQAGRLDWQELMDTVRRLNSFEGAREVFSERPFGGSVGTATRTY